MNTPVAVGTALGAAALLALGTALQYRAGNDLRTGTGSSAEGTAPSARMLVTSRTWLLGIAVQAVGLCLHALALHLGPLTLIQPLLIASLLFALPTSRWAGGPAVTAADMRWAAILVASTTLFLLTGTPASQTSRAVDTTPALLAFGLSLLGVVACVLGARRRTGATAAALLGVAAGITLAGSAAMLKVVTDVVASGITTLLATWPVFALFAVGVTAVLLTQLSYRAGPMTASLPAINAANPVASVILGTTVFDEHFRTGPRAVSFEVLLLAVVVASTVALSRRPAGEPGARASSEPGRGSI